MRLLKTNTIILFTAFLWLSSCKKEQDADAMGSFEVDEIIVSAKSNGQLLKFIVEEGMTIPEGTEVGYIDYKSAELQKIQVESSIQSLNEKTADVEPQVRSLQQQIGVLEAQLENAIRQQTRIQKLKEQEAATGKQLDDANTQVQVLNRQISSLQSQIVVAKNNVSTQNRSILSEKDPLAKRTEVIQDMIDNSKVVNPVSGVVLNRFVLQGEFVNMGMPLYKIANLDELYLRAYIDQTSLSDIKLGQKVKVRVDRDDDYAYYDGVITWISSEAEFTPKTIQTKSERENLVYAMKIKIQNDGKLKIGMYGEMVLNQDSK